MKNIVFFKQETFSLSTEAEDTLHHNLQSELVFFNP